MRFPAAEGIDIQDVELTLFGIVIGVIGAAAFFAQIADQITAVIDHISVALMHAAAMIGIRNIKNLVSMGKDARKLYPVFVCPTGIVISAGNGKGKTDIGQPPLEIDHSGSGNHVKANGTAAYKVADTVRIIIAQDIGQLLAERGDMFNLGHGTVPREAAGQIRIKYHSIPLQYI